MLQAHLIASAMLDTRKKMESASMSMNVPMTNGINAPPMLSASMNQVHSIVNVALDMKVTDSFVMMSMNVIKEPIIVMLMPTVPILLVRLIVHVILDMPVMVLTAVTSMNVTRTLITVT